MGDVRRPRHQLVAGEHRQHEHDVVEVGDAAVERIVGDEQVAGPDALRRMELEHALHRLVEHADERGDSGAGGGDVAGAVGDSRARVEHLVDDRAHRGLAQGGEHLVADRLERALDDLERDRVLAGDGHRARPFPFGDNEIVMLPYGSTVTSLSGCTTIVVADVSTIAGPAKPHPGLEQLADVHVGLVHALGGVVDAPAALDGVAERPSSRRHRSRGELADLGDRHHVRADELDRAVEPVGVLALVGVVEGAGDRLDRAGVDPPRRQRHLDAVLLVLVTELAVAEQAHAARVHALARELGERRALDLAEQIVEPRSVVGHELEQAGHEVVAAQVAHQHPPGREHVGRPRDHHLADPELGGERHRVHPAPAAERHQREVARVIAAVDRHQLERVDHVVVGDAHDAARRLGGVQLEAIGDRGHSPLDGGHVGLQFTAAKIIRINPSQGEVRVGRRRVVPAAAVGGRTGDGAGRARTDVQLAELVDPGDASASLADLDHVDHRHHRRIAGRGRAAFDPVVRHDPDLPALDQRALRGGPADVEREDVGLIDQPPERGGAPEPARRPGLDHRDRDLLGLPDRVHAAVGLHDVELTVEAGVLHTVDQPAQVALGHRLHVGRQHGRAGALVLAPLPRDLVRGDHRDLGPQLAHALEHGHLVGRVRVRVDQADRDRLHAGGAEVVDDPRQRREVERLALDALLGQDPGQLAAQPARDERRRLDVVQVEEVRPVSRARSRARRETRLR